MQNEQKDRFQLSARYSAEILDGNYTVIPNLLLENYHVLDTTGTAPKTLNSSEVMLLIHLLSYSWDSRNPHPTFATLARRMGMSETAVRNNARSLEKKKLLKRVTRKAQSNEYNLEPLLQKLTAIQKAKPKKRSKRDTSANVEVADA